MKPTQPSAHPSDFGLVAWLENTRVALPLKGVECNFQVTGAIASVEIDQIYHQNTALPLDCTYTFPLPAGAAVYRCELHANGRVIRAKVEDRENAQRIHREQKAAGRRTALVEMERENIFTLSLGNVQPGDVIVVRFAWFQVLDRNGDGLRLLVPTCPGIRYIPGKPLLRELSGRGAADDTDQVPDASRITPPRIDALHPDAAYLSINGRLSSADVETGTVSSPSHPICVREANGLMTVELYGHDAVPDRDFVLVWNEPKAKQVAPQAWQWTERDETYALVQLRAPDAVKVAPGFSQDFHFLLDRSGSMQGMKWQRACEAVRAFVGLLGAGDRVSITLFDTDYLDFAEAPMPAPRVMADKGFQRLELLNAGGGTELLPAVNHVLQQIASHSAGHRTTVVLITDGQVGNDQAIVKAFQQTPHVTVHTFGIDTAVNDAFLKTLARQQRGGCWLQTPDDDIAGTIAALGDRLRRPVLTELAVRGAWEAGRPTWPDLHAGEIVTIALRNSSASRLEITGRLPDGSEHCFAVQPGTIGSEAVKLLWANERIAALLESGRRPEAIALARQHNLICEGAAFIAWDEAEQNPIAQYEIVQPALEPAFRVIASHAFSAALASPDVDHIECLSGPDHFSPHLSAFRDRARGAAMHSQSKTDPDLIMKSRVAVVRELLQRENVLESTIDVFVRWAREDDTLERLNSLERAVNFIAEARRESITPLVRDGWERSIRQALGSSPEAMIQWADEARVSFKHFAELRQILSSAGTPEAVIDHLASWALESGTLDRERLEKIRTFAASLHRLPFSADSKARHWRTFVASTFSGHSRAWAPLHAWIAELETPVATEVT